MIVEMYFFTKTVQSFLTRFSPQISHLQASAKLRETEAYVMQVQNCAHGIPCIYISSTLLA